MLQLRGLLWIVTCTESLYCTKSSSFPICNDMLPNQAKTKQKYTFKQFKKFGVQKATNYRWLKKIEQKVHMENQNGLQSLQKIWNELNFMFVIYSCQKIEYRCIFYNDV